MSGNEIASVEKECDGDNKEDEKIFHIVIIAERMERVWVFCYDLIMGQSLIKNCKILIEAYKNGDLGQTIMPEDSYPQFKTKEGRLCYFTLPMALNYQRNSYTLWESARKTWEDKETRCVFDIKWVSQATAEELREKLLKYKVALQPNKHVKTWQTITKTIFENWKTLEKLFDAVDNDFLKLKQTLQIDYKKGFPYLSGPKIFNYWSFILSTYGKIPLSNRDSIDIAPDTHITKCSVKLGVITHDEAAKLSKDEISAIWKEKLKGSGIDPIDMHSPLWFWSHNGFILEIE